MKAGYLPAFVFILCAIARFMDCHALVPYGGARNDAYDDMRVTRPHKP